MLPINFISTLCISVGIASDNLMLSAMSKNLPVKIKPIQTLVLLFMLLNIQMQAFMYGSKLAKLLPNNINGIQKFITLSMLIATALRMYQEIKVSQKNKTTIPFGLSGFLSFALATSIYVLVLGFSLNTLQVHYNMAYLISMAMLAIMLSIGWYAGKTNRIKQLGSIKIISLIAMIIGIIVFLIQ